MRYGSRRGAWVAAFAAVTCFLALSVRSARADQIVYTLSNPNSALSCCTGPYATVTVNLTSSTTATITFDSLTNGGYIYLMGDGGTADLNVNGAYTLGAVSETNSLSGFTPSYKGNSSGQVDGFGTFNLSLDNNDGFTSSATEVSFGLTLTSGTWSSASNVLTNNANSAFAAIHAFACATSVSNPCTSSTGAYATGYVANGGSMNTPEPVSMILMGTFLLSAYALLRRRVAL